MQHITSTIELKEAIRQLEADCDFEGTQLKADFQYACKSLNPLNILRETLEETATFPLLLDNIIGTTLGLVTGFLTKKIVIGRSGNKLRLLAGSILEFILLNGISQRSDTIKSIGRFIMQNVLRKKERKF